MVTTKSKFLDDEEFKVTIVIIPSVIEEMKDDPSIVRKYVKTYTDVANELILEKLNEIHKIQIPK